MDMEMFIKWERNLLREERERLAKTMKTAEMPNRNLCPAEVLMKERPNNYLNSICVKSNEIKSAKSEIAKIPNDAIEKNADRAKTAPSKMQANATNSSMTTAWANLNNSNVEQMPAIDCKLVGTSNETISFYAHQDSEQENGNACIPPAYTKSDKELANQAAAHMTTGTDTSNTSRNSAAIVRRRQNKKDDMEQWVTDTFYSYFPGFNDELQKRQRHLRERQQENQQNFLKHQLAHPPVSKNVLYRDKRHDLSHRTVNTARSTSTTTSAATTTNTNSSSTMSSSHPIDKTELEIIVNNPGYVPPKQHTPRNKLLQDLRHTELSNIIGGDGVMERNRHTAELDSARKKDYQRELMQQIEEKRRSIEVLREKERRQEEALTRRLQEQLKTIQLEEQLEKEKMRADKVRFDSEQSRLMREHLLAKLENDTKLAYTKSKKNEHETKTNSYHTSTQRGEKPTPGTATTTDVAAIAADGVDNNSNKVYKYFSNSARHEYRRGKPMPEELELDLDLNITSLDEIKNSDELECFHLSEKVCPMCDAPLKSYESCCLRCQKKLSIRMHARNRNKKTDSDTINGNYDESQNKDDLADVAVIGVVDDETPIAGSYSMVCEKCERLYGLCPTCLAQNDVCRACHRKRNVCLNCRRTLCTRCLDEIASGRDTERRHINEAEDHHHVRPPANKKDADSVRSFQILEVNYGTEAGDNQSGAPTNVSPRRKVMSPVAAMDNESPTQPFVNPHQRPPYSMSIERNSIFHPDYNVMKQTSSFDNLDSTPSDEHFDIERIRKDTDNRLSRYLRNYADLAVNPRTRSRSDSGQDRSTQTTPNTAARRDVVMHEEHNLSMPLLREMPKMTRYESNRLQLKKPNNLVSNRIEQLKRRWEVPAVQKFTISTTKPKVLTQVGAIRKQLQAENILEDVLDDNV